MRVLIIQPWISYRGAETVSVQQAYYLQKLGHEAKIAAIFVDWRRLPQHGSEVNYLLPPKALSELCQNSRFFLFFLGPLLLLLVVLRNINKFDVLNPHNLPSVWIAAFLGKLFRKKVVWTAHTVPERVSWKSKKSIFEYFVWFFSASKIDIWVVRNVDIIFSPSLALSKVIKIRYGKESEVLYNGISEIPDYKKIFPQRILGLRKKNDLLLLHVGNLHQQKGQYLTLGLLKKLRNEGQSAAVIFAGDGPERDVLEVKAKNLNISDRVVFSGFISQLHLGSYYKICDLAILPSVKETFPAVPLEALYQGKTSIVSIDTGAKEVLSDYLLIAKPTVNDFYNAVKLYLSNKSFYLNKAKEGRKFILTQLSWKKYAQNFIKATNVLFYKEVPSTIYDKKYFDTHHEYPVKALRQEREERLSRAISFAKVKKGISILDLGCGNGELSFMLAKHGARVWGIDYSQEAINLAEKRRNNLSKDIKNNIHFLVMDAKNLDFPNDFFDRIICLDVFEHIYPKPLEKVVEEMTRVAKSNGIFVIETAPNKYFWGPVSYLVKRLFGWKDFESEKYHINVYDYFRFKKTLNKIPGFTKVSLYNDGHWYFSSRMEHAKGSFGKVIKIVARVVDFLHENPISEFIILNSPLRLFLAHDLWGVVIVQKIK